MARLLVLLCLLLTFLPMAAQAAQLDRAVPNGWWYSQTGLPNELGYPVHDDGAARFWSEFKRLGGVDALGYPVSQRFVLDGFTVQATQRVVMQWRPESGTVAFVNVFDRLHDLGQDGWLRSMRQTPPPAPIDDGAKPWEQVVRDRLALMDGYPAIKARYFATVGDAIQANGLPTSTVTDVGNHYSLRAQRAVFQQWKEDVPWAKAGQVTVALGGDMFKEVGLVPPGAAKPIAPDVGPGDAVPPLATAAVGPSGTSGAGPATPSTVGATSTPTAGPAAPSGSPPAIPADPGAPTAPIAGDLGRPMLGPTDFEGGKVAEELALDAALLARGKRDPVGYGRRLTEAGFVRGLRRTLSRDGGGRPMVVIAEIDLFRDPDGARRYVQVDATENAADPALRLDPLPSPGIGEESAAFRLVDGSAAARGYVVLFRRANAVGFVAVLAQVATPTLDDAVGLARIIDVRLKP